MWAPLGADHVGKGIAHHFNDCIELGAAFGLVSVLLGGVRLGDVLLQFRQHLALQCFDVEVGYVSFVSKPTDPDPPFGQHSATSIGQGRMTGQGVG